jgi:hypothetical protein
MFQLTSKYWMDSDDFQWMVGTRYKDKRSGKYYLRDPRYFSNITNALRWVTDQELKSCASVPKILARVMELRESLASKTDFIQR